MFHVFGTGGPHATHHPAIEGLAGRQQRVVELGQRGTALRNQMMEQSDPGTGLAGTAAAAASSNSNGPERSVDGVVNDFPQGDEMTTLYRSIKQIIYRHIVYVLHRL